MLHAIEARAKSRRSVIEPDRGSPAFVPTQVPRAFNMKSVAHLPRSTIEVVLLNKGAHFGNNLVTWGHSWDVLCLSSRGFFAAESLTMDHPE